MKSLRELARVLDVDRRIRRLCLLRPRERGYPRSVLSRFIHLIGAEMLRLILEEKVVMLLRRAGVEEVASVIDVRFIKAWSTRSPDDNRTGLSDPDAIVGRNGRGFGLGYKPATSVDPRRILSLVTLLASANENEKRHAPTLVERTRLVLDRAGVRLRCLVADSQYSGDRVRALVVHAVIPYMSNQMRGEDALRVDRLFRLHGSAGGWRCIVGGWLWRRWSRF